MNFSPQQAQAIDEVAAWLKDPSQQTFYLAGYAGTGKTTLAKHLAEQQDGASRFAAYTGKAASVLRKKGCNASTIHGLIYMVLPPNRELIQTTKEQLKKASGNAATELKRKLLDLYKPKFVLNDESEVNDLDLLVIDEVSMVGPQIGADLLSFGKKVLVLGDPGQLPPVEGGGYFTSREPDFLLTEVHRQAQGSPVINMATLVRKGSRLRLGAYGESAVISRHDVEGPKAMLEADQVIVGLNRTRKSLNSAIRDSLLGQTGMIPVTGEKIICLRNNHELGLLNGTQWRVEKAEDKGVYLELAVQPWDDSPRAEPLVVNAHHFDVNLAEVPFHSRKAAEEFDFGYAITCHKSQGSQWPHVLVQNESYAFRENSARWLYTAITRAEDRVTIAQ